MTAVGSMKWDMIGVMDGMIGLVADVGVEAAVSGAMVTVGMAVVVAVAAVLAMVTVVKVVLGVNLEETQGRKRIKDRQLKCNMVAMAATAGWKYAAKIAGYDERDEGKGGEGREVGY